jgi:hypothetical protein
VEGRDGHLGNDAPIQGEGKAETSNHHEDACVGDPDGVAEKYHCDTGREGNVQTVNG